jgi:hypothetical protein
MTCVDTDTFHGLRRLLQRVAVEEGLPLPRVSDTKAHSVIVWWPSPIPRAQCIRVEMDLAFRWEAVLAYWYEPFRMIYLTPFAPGALPEGKTLEDLCREACRAVKKELDQLA